MVSLGSYSCHEFTDVLQLVDYQLIEVYEFNHFLLNGIIYTYVYLEQVTFKQLQ